MCTHEFYRAWGQLHRQVLSEKTNRTPMSLISPPSQCHAVRRVFSKMLNECEKDKNLGLPPSSLELILCQPLLMSVTKH